MKKTTYLLLAMTIFVVLLASACGTSAAPVAQAPVQNAPAVVAPTQEVAPVAPAAPAQSFAPACAASTDSCAAPALKDTAPDETYCVQKIPYQNILVADGVSFESLNPDKLTCADNGTMVDGKHVVECHGTQLWTSELKLTNSTCGGSANLTAGSNQCQEGLGYDAAQNCCAPISTSGSDSVTIKVNMGACPDS